ncbi:UNVERIFIED_CONTAM: hypothetical protein Sradi_0858800 [Sesamum radiatum]|uniref:Uncharacterized protein n=1 Tax=Sesamum radiatum TaxID=300843 RepID=A0AAW2V3P4_SESRA
MCPTLQEPFVEHADAVGGFSRQQQRRYDPFSNTYNPGWKDHLNLSCGAQPQNFQRSQYRPPVPPPPPNTNQGTSLEDMMKALITNTQQIQQNTQQQIQQFQRSIQNLESQMSQLASSVSKLESQGASINVMPLTIFESLHVGPLKEIGVVIQLADRSVVYPEGVLEDVLVHVNELVFLADFYMLDMREDNSPNSTSILLGRPFLKTARMKIEVHIGTLSMEFDGKIIKFNIYDSMRYPSDIPTTLLVDIVDPFVQALSSTNSKDYVKFVLEESFTSMLAQILEEDITVYPNISESVFELESLSSSPLNLAFIELPQFRTKLLPSILQAPTLELKELPKHLKYTYLGENNTLPVIISRKLTPLEGKTNPSTSRVQGSHWMDHRRHQKFKPLHLHALDITQRKEPNHQEKLNTDSILQ